MENEINKEADDEKMRNPERGIHSLSGGHRTSERKKERKERKMRGTWEKRRDEREKKKEEKR